MEQRNTKYYQILNIWWYSYGSTEPYFKVTINYGGMSRQRAFVFIYY